MVCIDWSRHEVGGGWLVSATVRTEGAVARRVAVAIEGDHAVWPPRRSRVPEVGWADRTLTLGVPAEGAVGFGFATPTAPAEPPGTVVAAERVDDLSVATDDGPPDADGVIRRLADATPPRDAVALPVADGNGDAPDVDDGPAPEESGAARDQPPTDRWTAREWPVAGGDDLPAPLVDWLRAVETRVAHVEALAEAERLTATARALERTGGLDGAERRRDRLATDEGHLRALRERTEGLADRCVAAREGFDADALRRLT